MYQPVYFQQPRRGNTGLWIAVAVIVVLIGCICVAGVALLVLLPSSPVRLPVSWLATATPRTVVTPGGSTPTPTAAVPTLIVVPPTSQPDTPTSTVASPTSMPGAQIESFIPDLSGVVSAAFSFSRMSGTFRVEGTGQFTLSDHWCVYEVGEEMYLADGDKLLIWSDANDGWVQVMSSDRLHDNPAYWLDLLSFASPTNVQVEDDGAVFAFFDVDVPFEQNTFGIRDLRGSGWFRWDPDSGMLRDLAYDLVYLDRLGTSNNEMLYMNFHKWNEPVVVPER